MRAPSIILLLVIAFLGGMAAYVVSVIRQAEPAPIELYQGVPLDAKLLQLDKRALDEAYHGHLIRLWNVWLTDGAKEAHRITNGLRIARQAYQQAAQQIAKRERELMQQQGVPMVPP